MAAPTAAEIAAGVKDAATAEGFDAVGIAPAEIGDGPARDLMDYLARGYHGDMGWLAAKRGAARHRPGRCGPRRGA